MAGQLIQIVYGDRSEEQKKACFPFADVYFNEKLTIFFENDPIKRLVMASKGDKIAVCSWKLKKKLTWYIGKPRELTQEVINSEYDVLSFTRNTKHHQMLANAGRHHKGFREAFERMLHLCGINCPGEVKIPIYQNHFSAKSEIYQDYIKEYLSPCMWALENDAELNKMGMADSNYAQLDPHAAAPSDYLMKHIGIPHYPLVPFLLERLFSVYVHNKKINVTWL